MKWKQARMKIKKKLYFNSLDKDHCNQPDWSCVRARIGTCVRMDAMRSPFVGYQPESGEAGKRGQDGRRHATSASMTLVANDNDDNNNNTIGEVFVQSR